MMKILNVLFINILLIFLLSNAIFPQDKSISKSVSIAPFQIISGNVNPKIAEDLQLQIGTNLENKGYRVKYLKSTDLKSNLSSSKDTDYFLSGFLKKKETLEILGQIYDPETGTIIDALNVTGSIEGLENLDISIEEANKTDQEVVNDFSEKISLRVRSNINKSVRNQNISEFVTNNPEISSKNLPVPKEDLKSESEEIFQLMAAKEINVASNVIKDSNKQPVSVTVISRKQIQLSGSRTLNEVLRTYVPGFFTVEFQDDTIAGFRGLVPDANAKTLLLVNGHNMNMEWQFGPPDSILNGMSMDYIERIEVIRGPGSVTLGQGALLGVINIITRDGGNYQGTSMQVGAGADGYRNLNFQSGGKGKEIEDLKTYFFVNKGRYNGQEIRNEGWAKTRPYEGSIIRNYDLITDQREIDSLEPEPFPTPLGTLYPYANISQSSGSRLKRSQNETVVGNIEYKKFRVDGMISNQTRDLYNFYRDRNAVFSNVANIGITQGFSITDDIELKVKGFYTQDDYGFLNHEGFTMAGSRENRYGGSAILNLSPFKNNQLAIGSEVRKYDMGQRDFRGNNFVVNRADPESLFPYVGDPEIPENKTVNDTNQFANPSSIQVASFFLEDFHKLTESLDIFGAFRYDTHPFWGSNISPRIGLLYEANRDWRFRLSYQEGFRGAVGVAYVGGYRRDGLLRTSNFNQVELAQIPTVDANGNQTFYNNIPETRPEKMRSYEIGTKWQPNSKWSFDGVFFYNQVENIIDVGVIFPEPFGDGAPELGDDIPGDWGGYFFFRNTPGILKQAGGEFIISYNSDWFGVDLSHSVVRVVSADEEIFGSIYISSNSANRRHSAYPENVSRANIMFFPIDKLTLSMNYLHFYDWYAPTGDRVIGTGIMNAGIGYNFTENMELIFSAKNILDSNVLYPLNNAAGDVALGAGTPSLEGRTYWVNFRYTF
ncbi:MAG: TonB-dependent receptor [Leptospira sp.]|nr:TonB-dependent receptor [Leptospira sp.]